MDEKKEISGGGDAFPFVVPTPNNWGVSTGMTRRQWLAGLAMQGIIQREKDCKDKACHLLPPFALIVEWSYEYADAMIAYEKSESQEAPSHGQ